jgi:two-component system nitrate/nitrite response regulator NarP
MLVDPEAMQEFFPIMDAGVSGYLSKNIDQAKLVASLHLIAKGEVVLSREVAAGLAEAENNAGHPHEHLTERELQVLAMVGTGATNKEIAESLIITENTVKVHLRNILDKLNLRNRQQAAAYAAEQGIKADLPEEAFHREAA